MKEQEYIDGIIAHDTTVLNEIYAKNSNYIKLHITRTGGTLEDAKDVFQDALMVIYQKAQVDDFELTSQFSTYLISICRFIWDRKRKKKSNNTVTIPEDNRLTISKDIELELEQRERYDIFKENILKLGVDCQRILQLFFEKKTMAEIAELMDLKNEHTARNRKYRCQKELTQFINADPRFKDYKK